MEDAYKEIAISFTFPCPVWYNSRVKGGEDVSEEKSGKGPVKLWNQALRAVKGDNAGQLVEDFTAEMTLVAEGLVEDQAKLRRALDEMTRTQDRAAQTLTSEMEALSSELREHQQDTLRRLDALDKRVNAMEKHYDALEKRRSGKISPAWMDKLLILAGVVCGSWVLVTILNLFR